MKNEHDPIEKDPVWDLLRSAPRPEASPRFVDDVVRAARLSSPALPWWRKFSLPLSLGGLTAATAALVLTLVLTNHRAQPPSTEVVVNPGTDKTESLEVLNELVRSEALAVVAENPGHFTDAELVSLIVY